MEIEIEGNIFEGNKNFNIVLEIEGDDPQKANGGNNRQQIFGCQPQRDESVFSFRQGDW